MILFSLRMTKQFGRRFPNRLKYIRWIAGVVQNVLLEAVVYWVRTW